MFAYSLLFVTIALMFAARYLWIRWLSRPRPSDIAFIKARLEEGEHRVVEIHPDGFILGGRFRRSSASYRKYKVTVRSALGAVRVYEMGVWANAFGIRGLVDLDKPHA
jgi:hypothetical protein